MRMYLSELLIVWLEGNHFGQETVAAFPGCTNVNHPNCFELQQRMALLAAKICVPNINSVERPENKSCKLQFRCDVVKSCLLSRRHIIARTAASLLAVVNFNCVLTPMLRVRAESDDRNEEDVEGVVGAIKSLFDPDEKTKSGKVLPKAYVKSAREVVKTLRESLQEDPRM